MKENLSSKMILIWTGPVLGLVKKNQAHDMMLNSSKMMRWTTIQKSSLPKTLQFRTKLQLPLHRKCWDLKSQLSTNLNNSPNLKNNFWQSKWLTWKSSRKLLWNREPGSNPKTSTNFQKFLKKQWTIRITMPKSQKFLEIKVQGTSTNFVDQGLKLKTS